MKSMIGTTVPRLGAVAALTVLALAGSPSVLAQPATPTGITLTCPTPTSTGNSVTQNTAATIWGINVDGGGVNPAVLYDHGSPSWSDGPAGRSGWIGAVAGPSALVVAYTLTVDASDPNIVPGSGQITYSYNVDNTVTAVDWNGAALTAGAASYTGAPYVLPAPLPVTLAAANTLTFTTSNAGNPYGLNAVVTLTYDCAALPAPAAATPVPVDNPWALAALAAALGVAGAGLARRRQSGRQR